MAAITSSRRMSLGSLSSRSWASASVREVFTAPGQDTFGRSGREYDDQEELIWAAIERLPTYDRTRKGILKKVLEDGKVVREEVDFTHLGDQQKKRLMESILRVVDDDNERFLRSLRDRTDRVGIDIPKVEVRFEHLSITGDTHVGSRALPTLLNSTLNVIEGILEKVRIIPSKKKAVSILDDVSGIVRPSRMTLLLGPPGAGKTILLKALAGKLDKDLKVNGKITYCGHELMEFVPQRTCSYISQHDLHHGEMTVRETLNFSGRCLGVGTRYDLLVELARREKESGIKPDPEIDAFMKATAVAGQESSLVTDYVLKILGLDICADILVGDEMRRGISGGQKKRLTTGEMLVGPAKVFYMDEISTGLDSSTTFQIVKYMRQMVHIMDVTMIISLLQPAPETFELFDDVILLSEGKIVYQGPRGNILEFFESVGFKCPERKGVADFLQEVTSVKDQEQYWFKKNEPYRYISVEEFVDHFRSFHIGQNLCDELAVPYDRSKAHPAALVTEKYGISNMELFRACLSREWLLMKRNSFLYIFKTFQITIMSIITFTVFFRTEMRSGQLVDGGKFYGALFFSLINVMFNGTAELALTVLRLPVFFKQRDALFYPAWAFSLPIWLVRIPLSLMESLIWIVLTYYTIGFAPGADRFFRQLLAFFALHQMALSLFRFIAALGRTQVVANTLGTFTLLMVFVLGGFIIARDDIEPWMIWGYYISPMMYGQNAIAINEFLDERWSTPNPDSRFNEPTVGKALLRMRGMFTEDYMYWICVAALFAFSIFFNICFIIALSYLNPFGDSRSVTVDDSDKKKKNLAASENLNNDRTEASQAETANAKKGMVLPFTPLSLAFDHVNYYVDMPAEMKKSGIEETRLQLLRDVSGAFRPGVLTALVGVSGAGKTTLMDVLAGRKTGGYIEGSISISGYPKNQSTFARISGYCEQTDIHSPHVTVYESIVYSAWLRLSPDVDKETRKMFVEQVMELIELNPLKNALVGLPGVDGLSTEQRKRLTIAVELVANPSIIFMDEPTSGLDARAAAIVMRTVRNTVDTGRTVVCTIHQPSIDIFEAFDELLLMKRGGQVIYAGPLGHHSHLLVEYFQSVPGVPEIKEGYNPATWMLDVTTPAMEAQLNVDFAQIYNNSDLYRRNEELIKQLSLPAPGSEDLYFPTQFAQSFINQCKACFWKQHLSYWRHPQYNSIRFFMTAIIGIIFGVIFWDKGGQLSTQQDLMNLLGAIYSAVMFLGGTNTSAVQSVVAVERTVFYREKAAGMYSALPYAFAQVAIETVYISIQTFIYSLLLYSMIGFDWRADRFFWFYFFVFMCFVYFTSYGMMLVAVTPNYQIAAIVMSFFLSFWNLFSGFLIARTDIPIWWRWYYWASPVAWTIYGLVTSQVGDRTDPIQIPGSGDIPLREYLENSLGYDYDFLGPVAGAHIGWVILFCIVFAYGIKFLNFQKRHAEAARAAYKIVSSYQGTRVAISTSAQRLGELATTVTGYGERTGHDSDGLW
ncbi:ABC transporter G family member 34 [Striga hermonthica]|uniref:ABC transporter G family member 34 n=1 Tax=Striga hermonthica TaxID=68872 RepID=A0A9N7NEW4_STRHE|nr:ABC transporter G family member 34 [Striga hermonthica]